MTVITPADMIVDELDDHFGKTQVRWISEPGELTQFGAFIETLHPGARSSIKHWHSDEDEMIYVQEGEVTLYEGDANVTLRAGDAATFKAGVPIGHTLKNEGESPVSYLVVGTRAENDRCTYPDHARVCVRRKGESVWLDDKGHPASNPYKE